MTPLTVAQVLAGTLQACQDAYSQADAPTIPKRAYIAHGVPVVQGEQLTVNLGGISATHPFPLAQIRAVKTTVIPSALVLIEVWRDCWPEPQVSAANKALPPPGAYTDAATVLAYDAATIFLWISTLAVTGGLIPALPGIQGADDVSLGTMLPLGPQGTRAGFRFPISVKLT